MPVVTLSNPLRSVYAASLGLPVRDYAVGEMLDVTQEAADRLKAAGYAVIVTTPGPGVLKYLSEQQTADALKDGSSIIGAAGRAALVPRPTGGADGQVLAKSGSDVVWSTISASGSVPDASTTTKGLVELATNTETTTGTSTTLAVTPAGLKAVTDALPSGGGSAPTTDASQLTTGILPAARIGDGSIAVGKLAFDPATQVELDAAILARRADGMTVLVASGGAYPARPSSSVVPGGHVLYIGTVTPTDAVDPDRWDNA